MQLLSLCKFTTRNKAISEMWERYWNDPQNQ